MTSLFIFQIPHLNQMGFLVLFMPNTEVIHSRRLVDQISSALTEYVRHLQNSLIIGISQPHSDLSELHEAFEETFRCSEPPEVEW